MERVGHMLKFTHKFLQIFQENIQMECKSIRCSNMRSPGNQNMNSKSRMDVERSLHRQTVNQNTLSIIPKLNI